MENEQAIYTTREIMPGVWNIDDYSGSSCYLIEGRDKALLIDTGWGAGDFAGLVASLTRLPVELVLTHAHGDHMRHTGCFSKIYMHPLDMALLPQMIARFAPLIEFPSIDIDRITPVTNGYTIDLGGSTTIEVLEIGGHTPGSIALLDSHHGLIATGDAIGSGIGVWLQLPESLTITEYRANLQHFATRLNALPPLVFLAGHRHQAHGLGRVKKDNPPCRGMVEDLIELCSRLERKEVAGRARTGLQRGGQKAFVVSLGRAALVYHQNSII
jgi:glyoxylase-like metal-dependent hydrolase (beta-lactamase superfamily II)